MFSSQTLNFRLFIYILNVYTLISTASCVYAQNYTSANDGKWNSSSSWAAMNSWEAATPTTSGGWGTIDIAHTIELDDQIDLGSRTLNINDGGYLTITGDATLSGGSTINVNKGGTLAIKGNALLNSVLQINRGGRVYIDGNVNLISSNYLVVAQNNKGVDKEEYADLVIKQNLIQESSGDIAVNYHGRVAIFGSVSGDGGGTIFTVNDGGQVYLDKDISYTGGGSSIQNNNNQSPFGLYVNGEVNINTADGSTVSSNISDKDEMFSSNIEFAEWVAAQPGSPLNSAQPVTLISFEVSQINETSIDLTWATASETNNSHFVIMRSQDAKKWEEVGQVQGNGNSTSEINYTFTDQAPKEGLNYYLLKQVDFDGMNESFTTVVAEFNTIANNLSVFPNPTANYLNVKFTTNRSSEGVSVKLLDLKGMVVKSEIVNTNTTKWDISDIKNDTYILQIKSEHGTLKSQRIIKN